MGWRWWLLGALLLSVGCAGCGGTSAENHDEKDKAEAGVHVKVVPARLGTVLDTVEGLGRCDALPDHLATLTPAVEGHVHALLVPEGGAVKKDDPIVELDQAVARAELAEKSAARDAAKAALVLLQSLPRPEERLPNELAVKQAELAVVQTQATLTRLQPLRERHEVSEQQLFDAQNALEQAKLKQQTAEATLKNMLIGPRPEAVSEAQSKIETAEAAVALTQAHFDFHTIRAPIDGVVESLNCHPGQTIAIGTNIGEIVDTNQVFAAVWLAPRLAAHVHVGQKALVAPGELGPAGADEEASDEGAKHPEEANESESGKAGQSGEAKDEKDEHSVDEAEKEPSSGPLTGKVAFIGKIADPQTGNLPIHILVDNPDGRLSIGQSVNVSIVQDEHENVLQVPTAAINDLGEGPLLSVVRDGKAVLLHPKVGTPRAGWAQVTGTDLKPGEPVIVEGGYNLPDGTEVKVGGDEDEAKPKAEAEAKPQSKDEAKPEAKDEAKPDTEEKAKPEAKKEAEEPSQPEAEPKAEAHS